MNIIIIGPPGCGKGTQSKKILEKYGLIYISTGDILRAEIKKESELGLKAKEFMNQGHLIPDDMVIKIVENILKENPNGEFLFDGFPRTVEQAKKLDTILNDTPLIVFGLNVKEDELMQRIIARSEHSERSDDNLNVIKERFVEYENKTKPVMTHYLQRVFERDNTKCVWLNGHNSIDTIFGTICLDINEMKEKESV